VTVDGAAGERIIDLARPANFAMIVMATHGRAGLRRAIIGSVTDLVVRGADVPVMVLRPGAAPKQPRDSKARVEFAGPTTCAL
jgi:nucleotide-binding universal stress UspA family protein